MRRFLALMLSVVMSIGMIAFTASAAKFTDVPSSDEALTKAVELLSSVGITTGTTETTFGTNEKVTRQQMATFIFRLLKAGEERQGGVNSTSFTDLDDPFYYHMISWANAKGIIKGKSETVFDPKGSIILQDAYTMLVRALEHEKTGVLSYPIGYIEKAEALGLDEGLSSKVDYTTPLTRGDVAILLYNAFFADMGTGNIAYENVYEEVNPNTLSAYLKLVEVKAYMVYDTIATKIHKLKKTVQRVVATPNYSLDDFAQTKEGAGLVRLSVFDDEYAGDEDLFGEIELERLMLSGEPDDLFLLDISIYYTEASNGEAEVLASSVIGEKKEAIAGSSGIFETAAGTGTSSYMFIDTNGNKVKKFTGKVSAGGLTGYLYNAPWSYLKPSDTSYQAQNADNASFIYLDASNRDPEAEEFVQDYNFKSHRDALGRGKEYWETVKLVGADYNLSGVAGREMASLKEEYHDDRGGGLYSPWGVYRGMMFNMATSTNYEIDVWDSDGDGRIEYIWYKPYAAGLVKVDESKLFKETHNIAFDRITGAEPNGSAFGNYGPIYAATEIPTIYPYGATNAGKEYQDGQIIIGYVNGPANYMKVTDIQELSYQSMVFDQYNVNNSDTISSLYFNGKSTSFPYAPYTYIGLPVNTGAAVTLGNSRYYSFNSVFFASTPYSSLYFAKADIGKEYLFATLSNGAVFHVKTADAELPSKYAILFPNDETGEYCLSVPVGKVENGVLMKTADYVPALIDGVRMDVPVKVTSATPESDDYPNRYDFSSYLGKLLSYTKNSNDEYVFEIAPTDAHNDASKLKTDNKDVFYAYQDDTGVYTPAMIKKSNGYYQFVNINGSQYDDAALSPFKYLNLLDSTVIVIESVDEEGDKVFKTYTKDTLPEWSPSNTLSKIKYIVKNNTDSGVIEDLIYMYAVLDGEETGYVRNIFDYRIVKSVKTAQVGDESVKFYDVYNPFTATIEEEYEATEELPDGFKNAIYPLTTKGYIAAGNKMGNVISLGNAAIDAITKDEQGLGLNRVEFYDEELGLLAVYDESKLFTVDSRTVITYLDLEKETIEKKSASILASTSKTYRCGENKNVPLVVFIASSEIDNEDDFEHAELVVVVRYDALESTLEALN